MRLHDKLETNKKLVNKKTAEKHKYTHGLSWSSDGAGELWTGTHARTRVAIATSIVYCSFSPIRFSTHRSIDVRLRSSQIYFFLRSPSLPSSSSSFPVIHIIVCGVRQWFFSLKLKAHSNRTGERKKKKNEERNFRLPIIMFSIFRFITKLCCVYVEIVRELGIGLSLLRRSCVRAVCVCFFT